MNKRGFTLIEIIVAIALISLIGVSSTFIIMKFNNTETIDNITDRIIDAANVYLASEKDEFGNTYENGINMGGVGLKIPLNSLINSGYLNENIIKTLEKNNIKKDEAYLLASYFGENSDECNGKNMIKIITSWSNDKPTYICPYEKNKKSVPSLNIIDFLDDRNIDFSKWAVPEEYYNNSSETEKQKMNTANGIYTYYNSDTNNTYNFYRGNIDYNYLKFGKDSNGNDLIFRIIWYRKNDSSMKIILDNQIDIMIENYNNNLVKIPSVLSQLQVGSKSLKGNSNPLFEENDSILDLEVASDRTGYYRYTTNNEYIFKDPNRYFTSAMGYYNYSLYRTDNIYYGELLKWFNGTTLKNINYITDNKFCKNTKYSSRSGDSFSSYTYEPSKNFDCNGNSSISGYKIGFLTYGDANMAGVGNTSLNSYEGINNYLLGGNDEIILENINSYRESYDSDSYEILSIYLISKSGFSTNTIYRYSYIRNTMYDDPGDYYNFDNQGNKWKNYYLYMYYLPSQSIKPALILNMGNKKLINSGTIDDPFEIVDK